MRLTHGIVTLLTGLALAAGTGCKKPEAAPAGPAGGFAIPVETAPATVERVVDTVSAVGTLDANERVQIKSEIAGRIVKISFDEGQAVKKGDVLFQLDDAKLQADLEVTEARLEKARNNLDRSRRLLEQKTISPQEFDDAQAEFRSASALVVLARERLADSTIRSPINGRASERLVSPGQFIDKGQTLVTVVDNDPMKLDFSVPERHLPALKVSQPVNLRLPAAAGETFRGEVYFIAPQVDPSTRAVQLKATLPNPAGKLRAGLFANVELVLGNRDQAVVVPEQAIVPALDKVTIFVVEDGVARRREVTLGVRMPGKVEVMAGVAAGEQVVTSGQQKLRDQVPVMPLPPAPTNPAQ